MTQLNESPPDGARPPPANEAEGKVRASEWALAILLTILIGLSAAALLVTGVMELMFDSAAAWIRIGVLLPVLLIASYLLIELWLRLVHRRDAAEK